MNQLLDCRYGKMLFNEKDQFVGRSLKLYGEWSQGECSVFSQIVRPGNVVLELGANIGSHTVFLAQLATDRGRVFAFEPQRIIFQTLCANVALNNLKNVDCRHAAVGDRVSSIVVPRLDYDQECNFAGLGLGTFEVGEHVPLITVDSLDLPKCNFVKIDIEGMEREAILGAAKTIEKFKPMIYVENDRPDKSQALVTTIDELGYAMYWHEPPVFNANNFFHNSENVFGPVISRNMLCIHKSINQSIDARPVIV